jgi:hypothetical protein
MPWMFRRLSTGSALLCLLYALTLPAGAQGPGRARRGHEAELSEGCRQQLPAARRAEASRPACPVAHPVLGCVYEAHESCAS